MNIRRLTRYALTTLILQSPMALAETTTFECDYPTYSDGKLVKKVDAPFRLTFLLDLGAKKAYMIGNNGSSEITAIPNTDGVSFLEVTHSGNVMVTAITKNGRSVHSRSTIRSSLLSAVNSRTGCGLHG
jgi:hypothetical protein